MWALILLDCGSERLSLRAATDSDSVKGSQKLYYLQPFPLPENAQHDKCDRGHNP
jgi:hypothetical protein